VGALHHADQGLRRAHVEHLGGRVGGRRFGRFAVAVRVFGGVDGGGGRGCCGGCCGGGGRTGGREVVQRGHGHRRGQREQPAERRAALVRQPRVQPREAVPRSAVEPETTNYQ